MKLNNNDDSHNSGLNLLIYNMLLDIESHPAWVCGLKHGTFTVDRRFSMSHLAWLCGLKPNNSYHSRTPLAVTPCVGVWIETKQLGKVEHLSIVTPCVGVWIETFSVGTLEISSLVTPCVGVWIETSKACSKL